MASTTRVRVLIVEDEPKLAFAVKTLLELDPRVDVVGTATDAAGAVAQAFELRPDMVILDVRLSDGDGVTAGLRIREQLAEAEIVIYSGDEDAVEQAQQHVGITCAFLKGAIADELLACVDLAAGRLALTA